MLVRQVSGVCSEERLLNRNNFLGNVQAYATVSNPLFNNPTNTFSSNPRVIQITAKFFW